MADDTILFLTDISSLVTAIKIFKEFKKCSVLKLNLYKMKIIPIGKIKDKDISLPTELIAIQIKNGPFKTLGVWYSYDQEEVLKLNVEKEQL